MSISSAERRQELGAFLRARREQTLPGDVGLPGSSRRRTPGLRREELAALAGISTTWYTFLEQGRDVRPSGQVLGAIADALRMDDAARAHLLALTADTAAPEVDTEFVDPEVVRTVESIRTNPAYITGGALDLLAWNDAAADLLAGAMTPRRPNLAVWVFLSPAARDVLPDWSETAQALLARLRRNAGRHPGSARYKLLELKLRQGSREAEEWWPRYDIGQPGSGFKRIRAADGCLRTLAYSSFQVAGNAEQTLTIYRDT